MTYCSFALPEFNANYKNKQIRLDVRIVCLTTTLVSKLHRSSNRSFNKCSGSRGNHLMDRM